MEKTLPKSIKSGDDLIQWMHFFNGKSQEEFEVMSRESEYLDAAYQELKKMSADDEKRLEYEIREKALKDYNSQMNSALEMGMKRGEEIGEKRGIEITKQMIKLEREGKSFEEIAEICNSSVKKVEEILL